MVVCWWLQERRLDPLAFWWRKLRGRLFTGIANVYRHSTHEVPCLLAPYFGIEHKGVGWGHNPQGGLLAAGLLGSSSQRGLCRRTFPWIVPKWFSPSTLSFRIENHLQINILQDLSALHYLSIYWLGSFTSIASNGSQTGGNVYQFSLNCRSHF